MVVLHMKRGDRADGGGRGDDGFLYETSCATPVDALIADLVSSGLVFITWAEKEGGFLLSSSSSTVCMTCNTSPIEIGMGLQRTPAAPGPGQRLTFPPPAPGHPCC